MLLPLINVLIISYKVNIDKRLEKLIRCLKDTIHFHGCHLPHKQVVNKCL